RSTFCLAAFLAVLAVVITEKLYSDAFDHIDIDHVLINDEFRN
ncbi:hypothetical protein EAI_03266, partial [Harpegnathos saltator]